MANVTVLLSPDPETGGYAVIVPSMPGALTQGEDRDDALRNAAEVIQLWTEVAGERGMEPLPESPHLIANEVASVLEDREDAGWDNQILVTTISVELETAAA